MNVRNEGGLDVIELFVLSWDGKVRTHLNLLFCFGKGVIIIMGTTRSRRNKGRMQCLKYDVGKHS